MNYRRSLHCEPLLFLLLRERNGFSRPRRRDLSKRKAGAIEPVPGVDGGDWEVANDQFPPGRTAELGEQIERLLRGARKTTAAGAEALAAAP
jgi:hypothetical protein